MPKLLIVDDDAYIRTGIKQLIDWDELGIEIVGEAEGGREALRIFLETKPQLVLTDIRMPDGDGLDLIRNIREQNLNTRIIILSGYDEFDYVRKAMHYQVEDYLLKPVDADELKEIVKSCCEELVLYSKNERLRKESFQLLRNNVLVRWAENRIDYEQLRDKMNFLNIPFENIRIVQAAVITWKDAYKETLSDEEIDYRSFAILNSMEEVMENESKGVAFINAKQQIVCIFLGNDLDDQRFNKDNLSWLQKTSEKHASILKTPWYCTLGVPVHNPQLLHVSYEDALHLQNMIYLTGSVTCVDRNTITSCLEHPIPEIADHTTIIPDLLSGRRDVWTKSLNSDFKWALSQQNPVAAARYVAAEWIATIKEAERRLYPNAVKERVIEEDTLIAIFEQQNVSIIQEKIRWLLVQLEKTVQNRTLRYKNPIVEEVISYVQKNYHQDLSLKTLADQFNINSVYLGRLFKTETGDYFSDYLNKQRLKEAKHLLKDTHLRASEIAYRVGFQDPNYFYRKFKQSVGLSPTEYRSFISKTNS